MKVDILSSQIINNICEIIVAFFTAFMALGIWYAKNSLEEQRKAATIEAWNTVFDLWGRADELKARDYVLQEFRPESALSEEQLTNLRMVLVTCNRISMFVLDKLIDDQKLISFIGVTMLWIWEKTEPYIIKEREKSTAHYMYHFEEFIKRYRKDIEKLKDK